MSGRPFAGLAAGLREQGAGAWARLPIAGMAVLLIYYLAPRASGTVLVLLVGAPAVAAFLRQPALGPAALLLASPLVPFALGTGTQTSINITVLLVALLCGLWLLEMAFRRDLRLAPSRTVHPVLALCLVAVLAVGWGRLPWFALSSPASPAAQLGGLAVFLLSAGAFLLAADQARDLRWLRGLTWLFVGVGTLWVLGWAIPGLGRLNERFLYRATSGASQWWTWLVALALSQALFNRRLQRGWRWALGGVVVLLFYVGLAQIRGWASGWLPMLVTALTIALAGAPRVAVPVVLVGGTIGALNLQVVEGFVMVGSQQYSLMTRLEAWRIAYEIIKVSPVLGLGPANYYHYTPLYLLLGYRVQFTSHNQYVDLIAQTGLLGLAAFLWFAWEVARLGWRLRTRAPEGFARAYAIGALGGNRRVLAEGLPDGQAEGLEDRRRLFSAQLQSG